MNDILEKQFSGNAASQTKAMGGYKVAAEIMNNLDGSIEAELMEGIKEIDEDMGNQIQDLMFVFENLKEVDDRGIQALLREVSSDVLVVALKGADDELKEKIFKNMSKRAAELLRDDLETKPPMRLADVDGRAKRNPYYRAPYGRCRRNYVGWRWRPNGLTKSAPTKTLLVIAVDCSLYPRTRVSILR